MILDKASVRPLEFAALRYFALVFGTGVRVTLVEPGMVDTPFFDEPKPDVLRPEDVARAVVYALDQPPSVDLHELVVLPTQPIED